MRERLAKTRVVESLIKCWLQKIKHKKILILNLVLALQDEQSVAMYPVASCEAKNECTMESALWKEGDD